MCFSRQGEATLVDADSASDSKNDKEHKPIRITRAIKNVWARFMRRKKLSQDRSTYKAVRMGTRLFPSVTSLQTGNAIGGHPASASAPPLSSTAVVENMIAQLSVLIREVTDIGVARQAELAVARAESTVQARGLYAREPVPRVLADRPTPPDVRLSQASTVAELQSEPSIVHQAPASTSGDCSSRPLAPPATTSADAKTRSFPEPVFDNRRRRELLGRIDKFKFTHLVNAQIIEQMADVRTKVEMTCHNLLNVLCDMERLCSVWDEVTTGAPSAAVLTILAPWKRIGKEHVNKICQDMRRGIDQHAEWSSAASRLRCSSGDVMGEDWWAGWDKQLSEVEELRVDELVEQLDLVQLGCSGLKQEGSGAASSKEKQRLPIEPKTVQCAVPRPVALGQVKVARPPPASSPSDQPPRFSVKWRGHGKRPEPTERGALAPVDSTLLPATTKDSAPSRAEAQPCPPSLRLKPSSAASPSQRASGLVIPMTGDGHGTRNGMHSPAFLSRPKSLRERPVTPSPHVPRFNKVTAPPSPSNQPRD